MPNKLSVLIVEDDRVFRNVIAFTVARSGLAVEMAGNGDEAFGILCNHRVDFLVVDHQMPICTGLELLERLNRQNAFIVPPTILCSAKAMEHEITDAKQQYDLVAVLYKPFSPRQLSSLMLDHLSNEPRADRPDVLRGPVGAPFA